MYEILSELASFCKRHNNNILMCFFGSQFQLLFACKTKPDCYVSQGTVETLFR